MLDLAIGTKIFPGWQHSATHVRLSRSCLRKQGTNLISAEDGGLFNTEKEANKEGWDCWLHKVPIIR